MGDVIWQITTDACVSKGIRLHDHSRPRLTVIADGRNNDHVASSLLGRNLACVEFGYRLIPTQGIGLGLAEVCDLLRHSLPNRCDPWIRRDDAHPSYASRAPVALRLHVVCRGRHVNSPG